MPAILPNFFLAGAPKAGTTSLARYLAQHPEIFMSPVKEPSYFASEVRSENFAAIEHRTAAGLVADWKSYLALFRGAKLARAIGEASVCYLWSPTAPGNIAEAIPQARILLVLRDPADRAFSQYFQGVARRRIHWTFREHIDAGLADHDGLFRLTYPFLEFGDYAPQIRRYLHHFPAEQIHIRLYDDFQNDSQPFMREIFEFLGVNAGFTPDLSQRDHVYRQRVSLALSPYDRRYLVDHYRAGILDLQDLIRRDLSAWLA
jgi:hypothetical protein